MTTKLRLSFQRIHGSGFNEPKMQLFYTFIKKKTISVERYRENAKVAILNINPIKINVSVIIIVLLKM